MAKVFEDAFTDIQSGMVSLALEALETAGTVVDILYIYVFVTAHEGFFNLFAVKDGKLLRNHQLGVSDEILDQVFDLGIDDAFRLREVCETYGRPAPCQYKLVYDCRNGHFDGDYSYGDLSDSAYGSGGAFEDWAKEIGKTCSDAPESVG